MTRAEMLARLASGPQEWDIVVIGGGATGVGVAIDAAARGYSVALFEAYDFGKGTSSRSTKLVHGGVRYLEQGDIKLVMHALKERGLLRRNAPHLVTDLAFVVPNYEWWEAPFYGLGLKIYNLLSGKYGFGSSRILSRDETLELLPTLSRNGLRGGVVYYDGQFDDARLLIDMVATAAEQGAVLLNYMPVVAFTRSNDGFIDGVKAVDRETGVEAVVAAKVVINATGPFTDGVRRLCDPAAPPMIAPSQGVHIVLDKSFLPGKSAIMVPHTSDKRVLFAIPWQDHVVVGTTDTAITEVPFEPSPFENEIEFLLDTAGRYLEKPPVRSDILSVFTGIRPLIKAGEVVNSAALSRDHTIHIDQHGLLTITGGKWTTYRHMAEDCVDNAALFGKLPERRCTTAGLRIHGWVGDAEDTAERDSPYASYGSNAAALKALAGKHSHLAERLHPALPYVAAQVVWAVRREMALHIEDILARRTRSLFLNARASLEMAGKVASLMARELEKPAEWEREQIEQFSQTAAHFLPGGE